MAVASSPDPALARAAAKAKAEGKVLELTGIAAAAGCKDLGQEWADSEHTGPSGRARIRIELRKLAVDRGASHLYFSDYRDDRLQRETASFYDCTASNSDDGPQAAVAGADRAAPHGAISAQVECVPTGSLSTNVTGTAQSFDVATTYGISGSLDYFVTPFLALGAAPGVVLNLKGEDGTSSATQLDLRARASLGPFASNGLAIHGYVTVGGSWIYLPGDVTSSGATLGFGLAANYPLGNAGFITFDVGYQLGSQSVSMGSVEVDLASNLLHLGIGIGNYL